MPRDGGAAVSKRLQQADLFALERDNPAKCQIDQECSHQEINRRQRATHVPQHIETMLDIGVRVLVSAAVCGLPAIGVEQRVELLDDLGLRCVPQQLDLDVGETPSRLYALASAFSDIQTMAKRCSSGIRSPGPVA